MSSETNNPSNSDDSVEETLEDVSPEENPAPALQDEVQEEPEIPKKKKGRGKWLFLLVLVLIAGGVAGGWYYSQEQFKQLQGQGAQEFVAQLTNMQRELAELREQIASQAARQANVESSLLASVDETEAQLLSIAQRISQTETTGTGDWELAEAEYLLRIANQRLVTSQDITGALEMMSAADNIFKELAYPELTQARRQLVADITRLSNVQPVDYEGIYFALDALLPLIAELSGIQIEHLSASEDSNSEGSSLAGYWAVVVDALSPYVVINSSADTAPQYLVSDEREALAKAEAQLLIRQAQLAMLAGEDELYQKALAGAADRIEEVFSADNETNSLVSTIHKYSERIISGEAVDISQSIRAVEAVVDQLTRIQQLEQ